MPGPCPIHCVVRPWESWATCSSTCGVQTVGRKRSIQTKPQYGGNKCPKLTDGPKSCNLPKCPIDCIPEPMWGSWGPCDAKCAGSKTRLRHRLVPAKYNGVECSKLVDSTSCNQKKPCEPCTTVGQWSAWSTCSATCGYGRRSRTRSRSGGQKCKSGTEKVQAVCMKTPCPPKACILDQKGSVCGTKYKPGRGVPKADADGKCTCQCKPGWGGKILIYIYFFMQITSDHWG